MFKFEHPWYLLALLLVVAALALLWWRRDRNRPVASYSNLGLLEKGGTTLRSRAWWVPTVLRVLALVLMVVAIARPQSGTSSREITSEGIDIMLVLDVSGSMKAEDFKPNNRLYVAKQVIRDFVEGRSNDRIGLVVFAAQSFTQCPLTLDYDVLTGFLDDIDFGMIEDGTAVGMALANAINRLRESEAKSKIVILLTDGVNNRGEIDPLTAAQMAEAMDIKVYTIGAGKPGNALYPVEDPVFGKRYVYIPNEIDEAVLQQIARQTGGLYYRAQSEQMLERVYEEISLLEKTEVKIKEYVQYRELFGYFAIAALACVVIGGVLSTTWLRTLP
ncbi:MAG: VWA domain-containing protein [candidate division Zixibacteria bacterium]|nr:VWA domain-containing protein [candidate division Zixibacteria bacterium]